MQTHAYAYAHNGADSILESQAFHKAAADVPGKAPLPNTP